MSNKNRVWFDYGRQAWVGDGRYVRCGHPETMACQCYGRLHEGEPALTSPPEPLPSLAELPPDDIYRIAIEERYGFLSAPEAAKLLDGYPDEWVLIRTGRERYKVPLRFLLPMTKAIEHQGDYVRDVALVAAREVTS